MSWFTPRTPDSASLEKLDALTAESIEQKCRAARLAQSIRMSAEVEQGKAEATLNKIEDRVAKQASRAAEAKLSGESLAVMETLKLLGKRH